MATLSRKQKRTRRHNRLRRKISGTAARPRMTVYLSGKHMYVQFIDDIAGRTLASASSKSPEFLQAGQKATMEGAQALGRIAAEKAKAEGIETVVFDRGGFTYHGRVKALADAAREAGLKF